MSVVNTPPGLFNVGYEPCLSLFNSPVPSQLNSPMALLSVQQNSPSGQPNPPMALVSGSEAMEDDDSEPR